MDSWELILALDQRLCFVNTSRDFKVTDEDKDVRESDRNSLLQRF